MNDEKGKDITIEVPCVEIIVNVEQVEVQKEK